MRWCWVSFQCRGVLLVWLRVGQGPTALTEGAVGGGVSDIFSLVYHFSFLSPSLWETARYRLKYCLKGPLNPKQRTNQMLHNRIMTLNIQEYLSLNDERRQAGRRLIEWASIQYFVFREHNSATIRNILMVLGHVGL